MGLQRSKKILIRKFLKSIYILVSDRYIFFPEYNTASFNLFIFSRFTIKERWTRMNNSSGSFDSGSLSDVSENID
jgi:hypothetical protein